jgi:hypothetical protein
MTIQQEVRLYDQERMRGNLHAWADITACVVPEIEKIRAQSQIRH